MTLPNVEPITCGVHQCSNAAILHITQFHEGSFTGIQHLCCAHGARYTTLAELAHRAQLTHRAQQAHESSRGQPVPMVLECIAFHDQSPLTVIVLRETDGRRLFLLPGDYYTSAAVSQSVQTLERPGTHHAMAMLLEACEASLQQIVVENRDSAGAFHTILTIRIYGITKRIDIRPSDALALSHVCKVPFMVNSSLLCEESSP